MTSSFCEFCEIKTKTDQLIFKNDQIFIFNDIDKASSRQHILICPIDHIPDIKTLSINQINLLKEMQKYGEIYLNLKWPNEKYRFGYHMPPNTSIDHLHLHGFVLPLKDQMKNMITYGYMLTGTEKIIEIIKNNEFKSNK